MKLNIALSNEKNIIFFTKFSSILLSKLLSFSSSRDRVHVQYAHADVHGDHDDHDEINFLKSPIVVVQLLYSTSAMIQLFDLQNERLSLLLVNYGVILQGISDYKNKS